MQYYHILKDGHAVYQPACKVLCSRKKYAEHSPELNNHLQAGVGRGNTGDKIEIEADIRRQQQRLHRFFWVETDGL